MARRRIVISLILLLLAGVLMFLGVITIPDSITRNLYFEGDWVDPGIKKIIELRSLVKWTGALFIIFSLFFIFVVQIQTFASRLSSAMQRPVVLLRRVPILFYLIIIAIASCYFRMIVANDMATYLDSALNIILGKGYVGTYGNLILSKPPGFSFILVVVFWFFGVSVFSALLVVKLFFVLNIAVIFFLARKLFGEKVAVISSLLCLASYNINYWSIRHLDHVWLFFVLLGILFIYKAFEERRFMYFILSAFIMGMGFWVLQIVILFLPLPLLLAVFVKKYRDRNNIPGILCFFLVFMATVFPWLSYLYNQSSSIKESLFFLIHQGGRLQPEFSSGVSNKIIHLLSIYLSGLTQYFYSPHHYYSLSSSTYFYIIFIVIWAFAIFMFFRKRDRNILFLLFIFLLFSPMLSYVGYYDLRLGKTILFILMSYIILAKLIVDGFYYVISRSRRIKVAGLTASNGLIILICLVLLLQLFMDKKKTAVLLAKDAFLYFSSVDKERIYGSGFNASNQLIGEWIKANLSEEDRVLSTWVVDGKAIYFYINARNQIYNLPLRSNEGLFYGQGHTLGKNCIFIDHFGTGVRPVDRIYFLDERDLFSYLEEEGIDYVVLTERRFFLMEYLEETLGLTEVARIKGDGEAVIFKVDKSKLHKVAGPNVYIVKGAYKVLNNWKELYPNKYNAFSYFLSSLSKNRIEVDYGYPEDDS